MAKHLQYKSTSHFAHLLVTIFFWPWALVWLICWYSNKRHNDEVDGRYQTERMHQQDREERARQHDEMMDLMRAQALANMAQNAQPPKGQWTEDDAKKSIG